MKDTIEDENIPYAKIKYQNYIAKFNVLREILNTETEDNEKFFEEYIANAQKTVSISAPMPVFFIITQ